jgi:hypothetical protein
MLKSAKYIFLIIYDEIHISIFFSEKEDKSTEELDEEKKTW